VDTQSVEPVTAVVATTGSPAPPCYTRAPVPGPPALSCVRSAPSGASWCAHTDPCAGAHAQCVPLPIPAAHAAQLPHVHCRRFNALSDSKGWATRHATTHPPPRPPTPTPTLCAGHRCQHPRPRAHVRVCVGVVWLCVRRQLGCVDGQGSLEAGSHLPGGLRRD